MHEVLRSLPILMTYFSKSTFLKSLLKFDAMWQMQYTKVTSGLVHPTRSDHKVASKQVPMSDIIHRFG